MNEGDETKEYRQIAPGRTENEMKQWPKDHAPMSAMQIEAMAPKVEALMDALKASLEASVGKKGRKK